MAVSHPEYSIFYLDGIALPHARLVHNLRIYSPALKEQIAAVTKEDLHRTSSGVQAGLFVWSGCSSVSHSCLGHLMAGLL